MPQAILFGTTAYKNASRLQRLLKTEWQIVPIQDESTVEHLHGALVDADALISPSFHAGMNVDSPRLRLVQALGAGVDAYDSESLPAGCVLCNVYEHAVPIAEYVLGAMINLTIGFAEYDQRLRQGFWDGTGRGDGEPHNELAGKTLGLIGFGTIGREITQRVSAFGIQSCAIRSRPSLDERDPRLQWVGGQEKLKKLLESSDFVVVCCSLTEESRGMLNAKTLSWMKPSAWLINVARAEIVEQHALFNALQERRIAGAVLDVWYRYPETIDQQALPSELPFHELENVLMTPHMSAWTHEMIERRWQKIAANLDALALGQPLQNVVPRKQRAAKQETP